MMNLLKKLAACGLSLTMILSLAACGVVLAPDFISLKQQKRFVQNHG